MGSFSQINMLDGSDKPPAHLFFFPVLGCSHWVFISSWLWSHKISEERPHISIESSWLPNGRTLDNNLFHYDGIDHNKGIDGYWIMNLPGS